MVFNAISDTIIRKQEVSFTSCFLYTLKQFAIFGFAEKGLKAVKPNAYRIVHRLIQGMPA